MNKITKIQLRDYVKHKLATDPIWAKSALIRIYEFQTSQEQSVESTIDHNGVGFSGTDGKILTSFAKQLETKRWLSDKQMYIVMKKMPKYWNQIVMISDPVKLESQVLSYLTRK